MLTRSLKDALRLHAETIKSGFTADVLTANQLIHLFSKHGLIREAAKMFDEMPKRNVYSWNAILFAHVKAQNLSKAQILFDAAPEKDTVTYNSMISGYAKAVGYEDRAVKLFLHMMRLNTVRARVDEFTLTTMMNLVAKVGHLSSGQQLHSVMAKTANDLSGFAVSSLIDMYSKCGNFDNALRVFDEVGHGMFDQVSKNALIAACCREGELELAENLFLSKPEMNDVVTWNTIISGLCHNGQEEKAVEIFKSMIKEGLNLNEYSLASVLDACSGIKNLKMGKEIHTWVLRREMDSNPFIASGIVDIYCKCGNMEIAESVYRTIKSENSFAATSMIVGYAGEGKMSEARTLFDSLAGRNSVIWTAMISGYVKIQQSDEAFELFRQLMTTDSRDYDALMFFNLIGACSEHAIVDHGKQIHACILKRGIEMEVKVGTALVDMYSKCGHIISAESLFWKLTTRDLVLYNVMIAGYAHHGYEHKALQLFQEMVERGYRPDAVTFIAILSACRHSGLVEEGERYFCSMTKDYSVLPERDHYACMIDLYGRANQFKKAVEFLEKIPMELDAVVLGTFINACKMNRNVELAKVAEEMLLKIEGDNGARYVQLAGVFGSEGKWDEMGRIMRKMRGKEVKKLAGSSWVHVTNTLHTFTSSDRSHAESVCVYAILDCLTQELHGDTVIEEEFTCWCSIST